GKGQGIASGGEAADRKRSGAFGNRSIRADMTADQVVGGVRDVNKREAGGAIAAGAGGVDSGISLAVFKVANSDVPPGAVRQGGIVGGGSAQAAGLIIADGEKHAVVKRVHAGQAEDRKAAVDAAAATAV